MQRGKNDIAKQRFASVILENRWGDWIADVINLIVRDGVLEFTDSHF